MMRISVVIGIIAIVLCAALLYIAHNAKRIDAPAQPGSGITVNVGGVIVVKPYAYVSVESNGKTVYFDEMRSLTEYGSWWLSNVLCTYKPASGQWIITTPFTMRIYHTGGYMDSPISKTWGANSTHMMFTITGTYITDQTLTLTHVVLWWRDGTNTNRNFTVDSLPNVQVNGAFSVSIIIVWYDQGAFTWNWPKVLHATLIETTRQPLSSIFVYDVGNTARAIEYNDQYSTFPAPWTTYETAKQGSVRVFAAFSNQAGPAPRDAYSFTITDLQPVSFATTGRGVAVSFTVPSTSYEIVLIMEYVFHYTSIELRYYRIVLLRWRPSNPVPAGTTVVLYLFPSGS